MIAVLCYQWFSASTFLSYVMALSTGMASLVSATLSWKETEVSIFFYHIFIQIVLYIYIYIYFFLRSWIFVFKHLYWSITASKWCVSFCFITKWISYTYTHVPISLPSHITLPPTLPIPPPPGGHKAPSRSPCAMRLLPTSYLFYIW